MARASPSGSKGGNSRMPNSDPRTRTDMNSKLSGQTVSPAMVIVPIVISFVLLFIFILRKYIKWNVTCDSDKRLDGKTVIITGANGGIGKATAYEMAKRGAKLYLGCRNNKKGEAVARMIRKKTGNEDVCSLLLDLASLKSIKDFVDNFKGFETTLHILINNGGYMGPRATTEDGYERNFGVNYLGHFYLTYLLKDKLKKCAPSRIINVCSDSYTQMEIDLEDLAIRNSYDSYKAYGRSKRAQLHSTVESHRNWFPDGILTYAVAPGPCATDLMRHIPGLRGRIIRAMARFLFKTPEEGCQTILYCALAAGLRDQSGRLFENCNPIKTKEYIKDKEFCKKLWNTSLHLCGLDEEITQEVIENIGSHGNSSTISDAISNTEDVLSETKKTK